MKKIVTLFLVALLVCTTMTSFAAELDFMDNITIDVKLSAATAKAGDTITASFYLYNTDAPGTYEMSNGGDSNIDFTYDSDVLTFVSSAMGCGLKDTFLTVADGNGTCLIEATKTYEIANDVPLFTVTFTVNDVAADTYDVITVDDSTLVVANGDGVQAFGAMTVTAQALEVEAAEEEEPAEEPITEIGTTFTTADNLTWEGIYTANYTKTFTGNTLSGSVGLGYTKDGEAKATSVAISPLNGTFANAEVSFTIAIVGVPSNVTINSVTPAIVAE